MQRKDDPPELARLFDAVVARVDDDAPRHVLADALQERGDSRGEFMMLQLRHGRAGPQPGDVTKERALVDRHWQDWLREVPGLLKPGLVFERGFLKAAVLRPRGVDVGSPTLRLLERLEVHPGGRASELGAPALDRLRGLFGLDAVALAAVLEGPARPRLEELEFSGPRLEAGSPEPAQVLALARFPALARLGLAPRPSRADAAWLAWLFEAPLARQLRRLAVALDWPVDVSSFHEQLARHGLPRLAVELRLVGLRIELDGPQVRLRFVDGAALRRLGQQVANLAAAGQLFPYERFEVWVGERRASREEQGRLGPLFQH